MSLIQSGERQPLFTQVAVLIKQCHECQFRSILRQAVNIDLDDFSIREAFNADGSDIFFQPTDDDFITVSRFNRDTSAESLRVEQFKQSRKTVAVAVVRCC